MEQKNKLKLIFYLLLSVSIISYVGINGFTNFGVIPLILFLLTIYVGIVLKSLQSKQRDSNSKKGCYNQECYHNEAQICNDEELPDICGKRKRGTLSSHK